MERDGHASHRHAGLFEEDFSRFDSRFLILELFVTTSCFVELVAHFFHSEGLRGPGDA